jgi:hypothetical protein
MKRILTSTLVVAVAMACGGKSQIDATGGSGGSVSGSAGSGGSVGGSGGSVGGSSGFGGAVGGSAGFGGSVGGSAGFGGSVGGNAGAAGSGGWPSIFEQICSELSTLPCGSPFAECMSELEQALQYTEDIGCDGPYKSVLLCAVNAGFSCSPGQNEPILHPACQPALDEFQNCIQGGDCTYYGGPGACGISCLGWSADCKEQNTSLVCSCSTGVSFGITGSCSSDWESLAENACGP